MHHPRPQPARRLAAGLLLGLAVWSLGACDRGTPSSGGATAGPAGSTGGETSNAAGSVSVPAAAGSPTAIDMPAPPPPAVLAGPPHMQFASATYDFGKMPEVETRTARLGFTNAGANVLEIREVKTSCGCTTPNLAKRSYAPGESGVIEITFDPSAPGEQRQTVTVFTNGEPNPVQVTITADVLPFVILEPRMVRLGQLEYGQEHTTRVTVDSVDPEYVITMVSTDNPHVRARLLDPGHDPATGTARTIEITIAPDAAWGGLHAWLEVRIEGVPSPGAARITHTAKARVQGQVFGQLTAEPDAFRFGPKPGESFERTLRITRADGAPFTLFEAVLDIRGLDAPGVSVQRLGENEYELLFTTSGSRRVGQRRGTVTIRTDVPGEETLEIPIIGVIRSPPGGG